VEECAYFNMLDGEEQEMNSRQSVTATLSLMGLKLVSFTDAWQCFTLNVSPFILRRMDYADNVGQLNAYFVP